MSTNKQSIASSEHDDVPAASLPSPVASLSQRTPLESLRQADEPPSEAKTTPKASQPDSLSKAGEGLIGYGTEYLETDAPTMAACKVQPASSSSSASSCATS